MALPDSRYAWDFCHCRLEILDLVMRVARVHFSAGVAGKLLPDFLRHARIGHGGVERVPQSVR